MRKQNASQQRRLLGDVWCKASTPINIPTPNTNDPSLFSQFFIKKSFFPYMTLYILFSGVTQLRIDMVFFLS